MLVASAGPAGAKSAAEVFAEVAPSVVVVLALDDNGETVAQGSGVVVGKNEVATNCHVIEDANSVAVRQAADSGGGETYRMDSRILTRDGERDLCLLFVGELSEPPAAPIAAMGAAKGLAVGEEVYAIGAPEGLELSLSRGVVSQLRGVHGKRVAPLVQTDAAISPGSSGGGLFNADGELVGITTFKWRGESLNFAIPAEWVGELRDRAAALRGTPSPRTENFKAGELNAGRYTSHLFEAARKNDVKAVRWLIANGAGVNDGRKLNIISSSIPKTTTDKPLHWAAASNASEVAAVLIASGAGVNAKSKGGNTPLLWAAASNASETAAVLITNGADINAKNSDGNTPLHAAAGYNTIEYDTLLGFIEWLWRDSSEVAAVLIANGADINAKNNDGNTPLHVAVPGDKPKTAAVLIANGAEVNAKNSRGEMPLHIAVEENSPKTAAVLIAGGADINAIWVGLPPLHMAAQQNAPETAAVLIDNGANVNAKDGGGNTPLDWAADRNASEAAAVLLANGAEVNAKDNYGWTPLHSAALHNASEAATVLLANGAEVNAKNNDGNTPLDWAIHEGHSKMQSLLRKHGGQCNLWC